MNRVDRGTINSVVAAAPVAPTRAGDFPEPARMAGGKIKTTTMAKSSAVVFLGTLIGRALNFLTQVVLSNLLGLKAFGTFTYCSAVLSFLGAACLGGFTHTTVRYLAMARANNQPAEMRAVIRLALYVMGLLTMVAGLGLYCFRQLIASRWIGKPELAPFLGGVAMGLPGMVLLGWVGFALRGFRDVSSEALLRNLVQPLALILLVVVMAGVMKLTLLWAIAALLVSTTIAAMVGVFRLWRHLPAVSSFDRPNVSARDILKYASSIWLTRLSSILMNQVDRLMIGALTTLSQVGIYHAAFRIADFQTLAMGSFVPMFSTAIAEAHAAGDRAGIICYYRMTVRWSMLVTLPICLGCCLFAEPILRLFGPEFVKGAPVLLIIALASLIDAGVGPAGQFLQMMGREKIEMFCLSAAAILAIGLNAILIPSYGALGAAFGTGSAMVCLNLARLFALRKFLGVFPYTKLSARLIAVSTLAAGLAWLVAPNGVWGKALTFVAIYVAGALGFCLDAEDRTMLQRIKNRLKK
ncbi:flippase [candidate division KSB1 bacterium]|nr:flippase [candidate division KSB1 bacterium]